MARLGDTAAREQEVYPQQGKKEGFLARARGTALTQMEKYSSQKNSSGFEDGLFSTLNLGVFLLKVTFLHL